MCYSIRVSTSKYRNALAITEGRVFRRSIDRGKKLFKEKGELRWRR